jgi:DNA-binding GntR family transcriptional regulator
MPDPASSAAHDRAGRVGNILADRLASVVIGREPGYSLPRRSVLARRFRVSLAEVDAAIDELVRRNLIRRFPTGGLRRAGPAEYVISMGRVPGLSSFIDPMDHRVANAGVRTSHGRAPGEIADALGLVRGAQVRVCRRLWTADDEAAATSVTYVPDEHADLIIDSSAAAQSARAGGQPSLAAGLNGSVMPGKPGFAIAVGAVRIEVQPPARSVARRLRLANGAPAVVVTARLDLVRRAHGAVGSGHAAHGSGSGKKPVALTVLALRPELFRVVFDTPGDGDAPASGQMRSDG